MTAFENIIKNSDIDIDNFFNKLKSQSMSFCGAAYVSKDKSVFNDCLKCIKKTACTELSKALQEHKKENTTESFNRLSKAIQLVRYS